MMVIGIGGEAAARIYKEVMQEGKFISPTDTPAQREHRDSLVIALDKIRASGAMVDAPKEWPS